MRISWKRVRDVLAKLREKDLDKVQGNLKLPPLTLVDILQGLVAATEVFVVV